jgi:type II secretory pathway pseudopilin PulG
MAITAIVVGSVATGYSIYQGERQNRQQKKALRLQEQANRDSRQAQKEAKDRADVEMNRANRKRADVSAIQSKEEQAALTGPAGTMLTGSQGVDPNQLNLGGNTLLGG